MKKVLLIALATSLYAGVSMAQTQPVFPEKFDVTADSRGVTIDQYIDEDTDTPTIELTGITDKEEVTLTFNLPEGWDGVIGYAIGGGLMNRNTRAESEWIPLSYYRSYMEDSVDKLYEGTRISFPADGKTGLYSFNLYAGDQVDVGNGFVIIVNVEKGEVPAPVFPKEFDVTADSNTVTIQQDIDEDTDAPLIMVTGTTDKDDVTLTFNLPEGWDGVIGSRFEGGIMNLNTRAEAEWISLSDYRASMEGSTDELYEGTKISLPTDNKPSLYTFNLYSGDQVDVANGFMVMVNVDKDDIPNAVDNIEIENSNARYFNLQGVEIVNPENGIFVKVADGKATKVVVK